MKTFKQYNLITELFDKPLPFKWKESDESFWRGSFKVGSASYETTAAEIGYDEWDVSFTKNGSYKASAGNDEIKVFSTVIAMVKEFAIKQNPKIILISASKHDTHEQSRVKLYKKLITKYAKSFGYKLTKFDDELETAFFDLKRIK